MHYAFLILNPIILSACETGVGDVKTGDGVYGLRRALVIAGSQTQLYGIYFLPRYLRTAIVAIHQLPKTKETLWLRILGKGRVQNSAIDELEALPEDEPLRTRALELLYSLKTTLEVSQNIDEEDRELIMRLSPLYTQKLEEATRRGEIKGEKQGERKIVENLLKIRFGSLDEQLSKIIEPLLSLPTEEFTPLLLQLSREELIERFGNRQSS